MKVAGIYVLLASAIAAVLTCSGRATEYWDLTSRGVETTGSVVQPTCANHQSFQYKFTAGDRTFRARDQHAGKPCTSLAAGDPVTVFYLPNDPRTSMVGVPRGE